MTLSLALSQSLPARRGRLPFNPASLFSQGEEGVLFDPSDLSSMYQGRTGTTAAAVGSPVGQLLDKSGNGNHAIAPSDAARPILARVPATGRRNLLTRTEEFDNAVWIKAPNVSVTANTDVAPDGTLSADTLTSGANQIEASISCSISTTYTNSIYIKKTVGATYQPSLYLLFTGGTLVIYTVRLDTDTGVATAVSASGFTAPLNFSSSDEGEYWRVSVSGNSNDNTTAVLRLYANLAASSASGAGSQVIWGAQVEQSSSATAYQKVVSTYDVTEAGVRDLYYLEFDGVDDELATSLDANTVFNTTLPDNDYLICAGARFVSAGGTAAPFDRRAFFGDAFGYSGMWAHTLNGGEAGIYHWHTSAATASAAYSIGQTAVFTGRRDASAGASGQIYMAVNGVSSAGVDVGAMNGSAGSLVIGRQFGTFFDGHLYGLVVCGKTSTAAEIINTERWLASKAGVTL